MQPNDDLKRWGEPPTDEQELRLAELLADALGRTDCQSVPRSPGDAILSTTDSFLGAPTDFAQAGQALVETSGLIDQMIGSVLERSGILTELATMIETTPEPVIRKTTVSLHLRVFREAANGQFVPVAGTSQGGAVLRDLRRVPAKPDRVFLQTGDRVRIEVLCDPDGYLTILNVGPQGTLNVLWPAPGERGVTPSRANVAVLIGDVELTPPAGKELLWAVWTRAPLAGGEVARLVQPGATLRDMQRIHDAVSRVKSEDWHAVVLELDHLGPVG